MNISLRELVVEVTRRCNMECSHCLRGDIQPVDIDLKYVEDIFKQINVIWTITFTGGEPSLAVDKIKGILLLAEQYEVEINNFYCVTNGLNNSKEFALVMMEWYMFCDENEISQVAFSNDQFHQYEKYVDPDSLYISTFKFFGLKNKESQFDNKYLLKQGRNNFGRSVSKGEFIIEPYDDTISIDGDMYLNCYGQLINGCDWSYENQGENMIGTSDMDLEKWAEKEIEEYEKEAI